MRSTALPALVALKIPACDSGSSSKLKSAGPVAASGLADKIPGCSGLITSTPSVISLEGIACTLQDRVQVEFATFARCGHELQRISDGGSSSESNPANAGCCIVQEDRRTAAVRANHVREPIDVDYNHVSKAIGGREAQG